MRSLLALRILAMTAVCSVIMVENTAFASQGCYARCIDNFNICKVLSNRAYNSCISQLNPPTTAGIQACARSLTNARQSCQQTAHACRAQCVSQEQSLEDIREQISEAIECGREGD